MTVSPGRTRFRVTVNCKTTSEKLVGLNTTIAAFEGEGDFFEMQIVGKIYEWQ